MSVVWGNDTVLLLIELYESRDLLWDTSHRDYRNKIKKNDAWEDIAKALKLPRKEIETKVHTLRSQFVRERKKVKSSKTTGSGRDDVKSSAWFAYDAMKFLLKGATTSGSLDTLDTNVSHTLVILSFVISNHGHITCDKYSANGFIFIYNLFIYNLLYGHTRKGKVTN